MMTLKDKVALVTGAGRGIGEAIALTLAREGAHIIVNDFDQAGAQATVAKVEALGRQALADGANIADRGQVKALFQSIKDTFGRLDILVNNAGITRDGLLLKLSEEHWDQVMAVNLKGVFNCTQLAAEMMSEQACGKIVNLSSASAQMGNIGQVNYAASKAGVIGMTKTLAKELAKFNINVNAVAPGFILTPMTEAVPDKVKDYLIKGIPLGRAGTPADVAEAVSFLVSEKSAYITGQVIACNGGMYV
jgi:3-oxoacyl-(acyl-carrier-protein) reductase